MKYSSSVNKYLSIIGFILFSLCIVSCTQRPDANESSNTRDTVSTDMPQAREPDQPLTGVPAIQAAYAGIISKLERGILDSISFKYSCNDEKRGTISYFSEGGKLRLIVHRYSEYDHFSAEKRYFVKDSTLFFTYIKTVTWSFESGPEGSTKDNITENRIYLVNEQPVKCLEKKFVIHSKAANQPRSETVPNKDVNCESSKVIMKPYLQLLKFRNNPTTGCID